VLVQRDPRNVFLSWRHFRRRRRAGAPALAVFLAVFLAQAFARRALGVLGDDPLVLRYEAMRGDLEGQLRRLADWLGVVAPAAALGPMARDLTFEGMAGRRYGDLRDGDYFRGGSDWTTELSATERVVASLFDPLVGLLGYPPAAP
jgi:hypothetical protein